MNKPFKPQITLFHCTNTFDDSVCLPVISDETVELKTVKMACSGMVKDVYLLRAFESGSDAVVVMMCPEGKCRYVEGNIRAKKRINWVKSLLDEIELDGKRLTLHHIASGDVAAADGVVRQILAELNDLGPNPAK